MKVFQNLKEAESKAHPSCPKQLLTNTVFKIVGGTHVNLRVSEGYVDLMTGFFTKDIHQIGTVDIVYPNARIILE